MQGSVWHYAGTSLFWNISITFEQNMSANATLTTVCCVHPNVHGLVNTCCIRYHTTVDSVHSTSPPVHAYHTLTSVSVEVPHDILSIVANNNVKRVDNSRSIGVVSVTQDTSTWRLVTCTACWVNSHTEQGTITFTNVLQGHWVFECLEDQNN